MDDGVRRTTNDSHSHYLKTPSTLDVNVTSLCVSTVALIVPVS